MLGRIKNFARRVLPRRIIVAARFVLQPPLITYSKAYKNRADAVRDSTGYSEPSILETTRKAALAVKQGQAAYETDGVAHL